MCVLEIPAFQAREFQLPFILPHQERKTFDILQIFHF
jgi:hypothetical protein